MKNEKNLKVGDKVVANFDGFTGRIGKITAIKPELSWPIYVTFSDGYKGMFIEDELEYVIDEAESFKNV